MKIPNQIVIVTKEYVQIQTKLNLYIAKYGCKAVDSYLDSIPLRMTKVDGKHLGAYIIGKICQEYGITRYDLFESSGRQDNLAEARLFICVLAERYVKLQKTEMSKMFNKSRHFAKRLLHDFNILDELIEATQLLESFPDNQPVQASEEIPLEEQPQSEPLLSEPPETEVIE